jgi:hypothetical protein
VSAPVTTGATADLLQRLQAASTRSTALRTDAARLVHEARQHVLDDPQGFTVHGVVDGRPRVVRWRRGRLLAEPDVLLRLHLVVDLAVAGDAGPVPALDGDRTQLLLAVLRAFDRVSGVRLAVPDEAGSTHPARAGRDAGRAWA